MKFNFGKIKIIIKDNNNIYYKRAFDLLKVSIGNYIESYHSKKSYESTKQNF